MSHSLERPGPGHCLQLASVSEKQQANSAAMAEARVCAAEADFHTQLASATVRRGGGGHAAAGVRASLPQEGLAACTARGLYQTLIQTLRAASIGEGRGGLLSPAIQCVATRGTGHCS